jgi:hypothetical protein
MTDPEVQDMLNEDVYGGATPANASDTAWLRSLAEKLRTGRYAKSTGAAGLETAADTIDRQAAQIQKWKDRAFKWSGDLMAQADANDEQDRRIQLLEEALRLIENMPLPAPPFDDPAHAMRTIATRALKSRP